MLFIFPPTSALALFRRRYTQRERVLTIPVYNLPNVILHANNPNNPTPTPFQTHLPVFLLSSNSPKNSAIDRAFEECVEGKPYSSAWDPTESRMTGGEKGRGTQNASFKTEVT